MTMLSAFQMKNGLSLPDSNRLKIRRGLNGKPMYTKNQDGILVFTSVYLNTYLV